MFQVSSQLYFSYQPSLKPPPLGPRNPNACPRFSDSMASVRKEGNDKHIPFPKRAMQKYPVKRKPEEEQDRRRQVFLKKVREVSDDKKWESRSEQVRHSPLPPYWSIYQADAEPDLERGFSIEEKTMGVGSGKLGTWSRSHCGR